MSSSQFPVAGGATLRYQLVPRVLCFVCSGEDVLLLKGAPDKKIWPGKYNGLGGHVERGESVHAAARREIQEEAGIRVVDLRLRGIVTIDPGSQAGIGMFVFTAKAVGREYTTSPEGALEWVPLSQAPALDMVADLPVLLPYILSLPPGAAPFGAHYHYDAQDHLSIEFYSEDTGTDRAA